MERNVLLLYMSPFGRNPNIHTQTNEAAVQELRKHKEGPDYILALCSELVCTKPTVHLPDGKTCTTVEYFRDVFLPSVDIPAERLVVIPWMIKRSSGRSLCCWVKSKQKIPFPSTFLVVCGTLPCCW